MNISPINNATHINKTNSINKSQAVSKPLAFDSVSFSGKEKVSFLDKVKSFLGLEDVEIELTPQEQKDATIRGTFKGMQQAAKEYKRVAKIEVKTLNTLLEIGKLNGFKPYIPYEDGKKLLFGDFDDRNLPKRLDIVNIKNGMSIGKSYDFNCGNGLFTTTLRYSPRSNTTLDILHGKPLYMVDKNYEDGSFQRMTFLNNALHFISGPLNTTSDTSRIAQIAYFDYKNPDKCYYADLDEVEDFYNFYKYDSDEDLWVIDKKMTPEETEKFMQSQEF